MSGVLSLAPIIEVFRGLFICLFDLTDGKAHPLLVARIAGKSEEDVSAIGAYIPACFKRFLTIHHPAYCNIAVSMRQYSGKPIAPFVS